MARPSKISPEVQERIVQLIRAGATQEVAAQAGGIARSTFIEWMRRGRDGKAKADAPYREFRDAVERAHAEAESLLVSRITKAAANGSWSAAAWMLERRWPDRWAKPSERDRAERTREAEAKKPAPSFLDELAKRRNAA